MTERWFVLRVVTGREERVLERLKAEKRPCLVWRAQQRQWQEIRSVFPWLPLCTIRRIERKPDGRVVTRATEPMFPGHLLLRFDLDRSGVGAIEEIPGAINFVRIGSIADAPTPLQDGLVGKLMDYVGRKGGVIIDAASGRELPPWVDLPKGTAVKMIGGAFAGWNGIFQERVSDRLKILVDMFDRQVETLVPEALVVAA
jgi:transcription antitermination factor NusG